MSCLFNSLSYFLDENSHNIRQKICDYLQENKPIIDGLETHEVLRIENNEDASKYIQHMRALSTWGGAIEIQAACNIWNMCIIVKNYRDNSEKDIEFIPMNGERSKIIQVYWTGGHYEPIR
jgi:hypothetical protein